MPQSEKDNSIDYLQFNPPKAKQQDQYYAGNMLLYSVTDLFV